MEQLVFTQNAPIQYRMDVTVIGGGLAGCAAAIAAARNGAKTLLVEQTGMLGGMATLGHVSPLDARTTLSGKPFGGLIHEIVSRTEEMNKTYGGAYHALRMGPEFLRLVLLQMVKESGAEILFHASLAGVQRQGDRIEYAFVHTKSGMQAIASRQWVDASGDGDLVAQAGEEFTLGSEPGVFDELVIGGLDRVHFEAGKPTENYGGYQKSGLMQPVSMMLTMENVDFSKCDQLSNKLLTFEDLHIDRDEFFRLPYANTKGFEENGDLIPLPQGRILINRAAREDQILVNMSRVIGVDATNAQALSEAEEVAQMQILYLVDFLIRYVPGFEKARLAASSHTLGVRETRRLVGRYVLRGSEAINCASFDDVVAQGSYMIDIHDPQGKRKAIGGKLKKDCYSIPYGCLLPRTVQNLLVSGRCISVDHVAHSSTRIQGTCILTGQAAGTAAALAVQKEMSPASLPIAQLQQQLIQDGVHFYD